MINIILAISTINDRVIWSKYVKWVLIIAIAIILEVEIVLLILEIIGKRVKHTVVEAKTAIENEENAEAQTNDTLLLTINNTDITVNLAENGESVNENESIVENVCVENNMSEEKTVEESVTNEIVDEENSVEENLVPKNDSDNGIVEENVADEVAVEEIVEENVPLETYVENNETAFVDREYLFSSNDYDDTIEIFEEPLNDKADSLSDDADSDVEFDAFGNRIIYRKSFMARLILSQSPNQDFYEEIKNELLAYKGIKSKVSWSYDSFNKGRKKCVKLAIKGKSLIMYIALNPENYEVAKYHHEDVSGVVRYQDVPFAMKIRSKRAVKYANELIAYLMNELGLQKRDIAFESYRYPYESKEQLIERGLIKVDVRENQNKVDTDDSQKEIETQENEDIAVEEISEIVENVCEDIETIENKENDVQTTEIVENNENGEESKVEENILANENEENEDSSYIPPERDFEILRSVNSNEVSDLMKTEVAVANIENDMEEDFEVGYSNDAHKTIVNVDVLRKAFNAGEIITLEKMKKKKLVVKKATYVKVLARGLLDKPLVVVADSFSIEATKMILLTGGRVIQKKKK